MPFTAESKVSDGTRRPRASTLHRWTALDTLLTANADGMFTAPYTSQQVEAWADKRGHVLPTPPIPAVEGGVNVTVEVVTPKATK